MNIDKEYMLLETLSVNENFNQRQLSSILGISLGGINILINKMIKEGLIKVKSIPSKRAIYMLTPKGMVEKANKTYKYITHHYNYINETKEKIKKYLEYQVSVEDKIYIVLREDELSQIIKLALIEIGNSEKIEVISSNNEIKSSGEKVIIIKDEDKKVFKCFNTESLLEKI